MDEPSTGLDPASRNNLWSVVKEAKKNRAIILTSIEFFYYSIYYLYIQDNVNSSNHFNSTLNGGSRSTM
jgi:ABC-type Mn2+/Zn2+ transport system ATPase subunit